jgi:hypothetical protein
MRRVAAIFAFLLFCLTCFGQAKVIFVNGRIGMGSPKGGEVYWQKDSTFIDSTLVAMHSTVEPFFTDVQYPLLSKASERKRMGYEYAVEHIGEIAAGSGGTFRMVTHSMGAAFGEGIAQCLVDRGYKVDIIVHFEPYQAPDIETIGSSGNILTIDYQVLDDWLIHIGGKGRIRNADLLLGNYRSGAPLHKKHRYPINHSATWRELQPYIDEFLSEAHDD